MLNHITLHVSNLEKSKTFFCAALAPLGYKLLIEKGHSAGFGQEDVAGKRDFWIRQCEIVTYHPGYYAAYVLDRDGYNIEAVWDDPEK